MAKKIIPFALVISIVIFSAFCTNNKQLPVSTVNNSKQPGFALVELFTSEGCSSCPAADRAVEELAKQYPDDVYVLAFHVDYWNRLGWTDEFSKADYTQRQSDYASQFNLSSIYTPQVVINGRHEFVGSDKTKLQFITSAEIKNAVNKKLELTTDGLAGKTVTVNYKTEGASGEILHIALVQTEASTDVKRGENGGRKLHHINIVRDFKTVSAKNGTVQLQIPSALTTADVKVIAYLQQKDGTVTAVQKINAGGI